MLLAAANEGLGAAFHIPVSDEAGKIKEIVKAPEEYEFICLLTIGYPAENAHICKQKEIRTEDRIQECLVAAAAYSRQDAQRSRSAHVVPFDEGIAGSGLAVRSPSPFLRALSVGAVVRTSAEKYLILSKDSP